MTHCSNKKCKVLLTEENKRHFFYTLENGQKRARYGSRCKACFIAKETAKKERDRGVIQRKEKMLAKKKEQAEEREAISNRQAEKVERRKWCSKEDCGILLTKENRIPGRNRCRKCQNTDMNERNAKKGINKPLKDFSLCLDCKIKKTEDNTKIKNISKVTGKNLFDSYCKDCFNKRQRVKRGAKYKDCTCCLKSKRTTSFETGNEVCKRCINRNTMGAKIKRKLRLTTKKTVKFIPAPIPKRIEAPIVRTSTAEKMAKLFREKEDKQNKVNLTLAQKLTMEFESKNNVTIVKVDDNLPEAYTGTLIPTRTYVGKPNKYNFD